MIKTNMFCSRVLTVKFVMAAAFFGVSYDVKAEDFQGEKVGTPPSNAHLITPQAEVTIVDGGSADPDPFGGARNQSMLIDTTRSGVNTYVVYGSDGSHEKGSLSMDIYAERKLSYTYIRLGNRSVYNGIPNDYTAVNLLIRWGQVFESWDAKGESLTLDGVLSPETVYSIRISFDSRAKTWNGTINGMPITANGGSVKTFDYFRKNASLSHKVSYIDRVHWYVPAVNGGALIFVDNVIFAGTQQTQKQ